MVVATLENRLTRQVHHVVVHPERNVGRRVDEGMRLVEGLWRHTDDRERPSRHPDLSPDDRRIAAKPAEPILVGQDDHRRIATRTSLVGLNQTANSRLYTEHREVVVGDAVHRDALGRVVAVQSSDRHGVAEQIVKGRAIFPVVLEVNERHAMRDLHVRVRPRTDGHELLGMTDRHRRATRTR